jgi:hypothetical protein
MEAVAGATGMIFSTDVGSAAGELFELSLDLDKAATQIAALTRNAPALSAVKALTAIQSLGLASTALLACIDTKCDLDQPPEPMDVRPRGTDHRLITRCKHDPPHCWEGTQFVECPDP